MEIFLFYELRKKGGIKKSVVLHKGRVLIVMRSLEVWNTLGLMPSSGPPSRERMHT
jgi:hypothetical protein